MIAAVIIKELKFKAVRSSGSGGQHVNKVSTKIELSFDLINSLGLTETEKVRLKHSIFSRLTTSGVLILSCGETRSQHRNKELVIQRLFEILKQNLRIPKPRKSTKPSRSSIRKRLDHKKKHSQKKKDRRKPSL